MNQHKELLKITKEEAEHHAKYGNITKVIKFPVPPTYEEFLKRTIYFANEDIGLTLTVRNNLVIRNCFMDAMRLQNTKENYYKALDKMVELWKGE